MVPLERLAIVETRRETSLPLPRVVQQKRSGAAFEAKFRRQLVIGIEVLTACPIQVSFVQLVEQCRDPSRRRSDRFGTTAT
jgi:hypothetical protein